MKKTLVIILLGTVLLTGILALPVSAGYFTDEGHTCWMYVGPWVWYAPPDDRPMWMPPDSAIGVLDLRSLPEQGTPGGIPGLGLFFCDKPLGSDYILLGNKFSDILTSNKLSALERTWNINLSSYTINGTIWEMFVEKGDPTGELRWKPLIPEINGKLVINIAGFSPVVFAKDPPRKFPAWRPFNFNPWKEFPRWHYFDFWRFPRHNIVWC